MHRSLAVRLILVAGLVLPTTALLGAVPAGAAGTITCSLTHATTVSPGLEQPPAGDPADAAQTFKLTANLTGYSGSVPAITSGKAVGTLHSISPKFPTCAALQTPGSTAGTTGTAKVTVTWNTGKINKTTLLVTVDAPFHGKLSGGPTSGYTPLSGLHVSGSTSFLPGAGEDCSDAHPVQHLNGNGTITLS